MNQLIGLKSEFIIEEQQMLKGEKQNDKLLHLKKILPPFNLSAKRVKNIYKIENLMYEKDSIDSTNLLNAIQECEESGSRHLSNPKKFPESIRYVHIYRIC